MDYYRQKELNRRAECAKQYPVGTKLSNGVVIVAAPTYKDRVMELAGQKAEIEIYDLSELCEANNVTII